MTVKSKNAVQGMELIWIVVKDVKQAVHYYTEILGLKLLSFQEEFQWAEVQGESGCVLGLAGACDYNPITAGQNAVISLTVKNLDESMKEFASKGVKKLGEVQEVPGHVKMQTCVDADGNHFQIVEKLAP